MLGNATNSPQVQTLNLQSGHYLDGALLHQLYYIITVYCIVILYKCRDSDFLSSLKQSII